MTTIDQIKAKQAELEKLIAELAIEVLEELARAIESKVLEQLRSGGVELPRPDRNAWPHGFHDLFTEAQLLDYGDRRAATEREKQRELIRRLYVELFHVDQQLCSVVDEDGIQMVTQGRTVGDVLSDAKQFLEAA